MDFANKHTHVWVQRRLSILSARMYFESGTLWGMSHLRRGKSHTCSSTMCSHHFVGNGEGWGGL